MLGVTSSLEGRGGGQETMSETGGIEGKGDMSTPSGATWGAEGESGADRCL